jgi:hypothetical protein
VVNASKFGKKYVTAPEVESVTICAIKVKNNIRLINSREFKDKLEIEVKITVTFRLSLMRNFQAEKNRFQ